ncbi:MAG TPA: pilus assembly protein PilM [Tepidisphaeraceae bacterium]|jgi:Tfp pilus assembly PilM family ATPase
MLWFCSKLTPIGVDLGGRCIKAAQLLKSRQGDELHAAAIIPVSAATASMERSIELLKRRVETGGFSGRSIVISSHASGHAVALESAGFRVKAVDCDCIALARACAAMAAQQPTFAIADIGWTRATFAIAHGGDILYKQQLRFAALGDVHASIIDRFGLSPDIAEGLLSDVYADFVASASPPESVHAAWTRTHLSRRLSDLTAELRELLLHASASP